jgi:hypothetical protein
VSVETELVKAAGAVDVVGGAAAGPARVAVVGGAAAVATVAGVVGAGAMVVVVLDDGTVSSVVVVDRLATGRRPPPHAARRATRDTDVAHARAPIARPHLRIGRQ